MKVILAIFLFCLLHLEKAEGEQSIQGFDHHWSIQAPGQARNGATVRKNKNVGRKHKKDKMGDSKRQIKRERSNQIKRRKERRQNKNKNGLKTKVSKTATKNMKQKNMKKENKKRKRDKKIRKKRKQKKKQHIKRKNNNTEKKDKRRIKQRKGMKRNKKTKNEKKRSKHLMKHTRRTKQIKKTKRNKKAKKEKNRSNKLMKKKLDGRDFYGPNGNKSDGKGVQEFECDIYGYTRDFSVALTQVNRVKRILNKPGRMDGIAMTDFSAAITALGAATQGGSRCYGSDTTYNNFMSGLIYDQLQSCKADLPRICNTSQISGYDPESSTNGRQQWQQCKGRLERFVKGYRMSIFKDPGGKYENVCRNLGNSWDSTNTSLIADVNASKSAGENISSPDTPLELWRDGCLPNTFANLDGALQARFGVCKDPLQLTSGSQGSCMTFLQASMLYVDLCNPLPPMFSTLTSFYTWANARAIILKNIIENIIYLRPFNSLRSYEVQNKETKEEHQVTVNLNFTSVIDAMSGTNCTDTDEYDILTKCHESIPDICSAILFDAKWGELGGDSCQQMIEDFTKDYELITDNTAIQPGSNSSRQPLNREGNFSSFISGYNLPLVANCIPRFCFDNEECYPENYNYKVTTLAELKEQFFISFEFKSIEGPPETDTSQTLIQFLDSNENPVLTLSVDHNKTELIVCSSTFEGENYCKDIKNVFTADKWHHVEFTQALENDAYTFQVNIDGSKKIKENGIQPKTFSTLHVSTATDDNTVKASLRNMFINTKGAKTEDQCKVTFKHATSSSVYVNDNDTYGPQFAIDGKTSTPDGNFFRSKYEDYPWLQIELSSPTDVSDVTIVNSRYGFKRWFMKAVISAGTVNAGARVCGTFEGPAAFGATINIECDSPIKADYVTVQLNYTGAILAVDEVKVNSQDVRPNHIHLNELMDNITKSGCLEEKYTDLEGNIETTLSTCFNATMKGSYASCDAARTTAYSYTNSCVGPTSSLTTKNLRQRRQLVYKKKLLSMNVAKK